MAKPLTRAQALQNRAFLRALRRTGNVRLACREVGAKYGTMQHRRRMHPAFALRWDAALAFAQAGLSAPSPRSRIRASRPSPAEGGGFRTAGGEAAPRSPQVRQAADAAGAGGEADARGGAGVSRRAQRDVQRDPRRGGGGLMLRRVQPAAEEGSGVRARDADGAAARLRGARAGATGKLAPRQPRA